MHTPSGRFQPSTRLCLSISDFHPKSFNPAWEVSTILIGLMSFMTSEEMTTGSLSATVAERKWYAARSRWWNSTGGGSSTQPVKGNIATTKGVGAVKAGDGGVKFRAEWEEQDEENWKWMERNNVDLATGKVIFKNGVSCSPEAAALMRGPSGSARVGGTAGAIGQGFIGRHKWAFAIAMLIIFAALKGLLIGRD